MRSRWKLLVLFAAVMMALSASAALADDPPKKQLPNGHAPLSKEEVHDLGKVKQKDSDGITIEHTGHPGVVCDHNFTWLPVTGDLYWGGYTQCNSWIELIGSQAHLYWWDGSQYIFLGSAPNNDCYNVSYCASREWYGSTPPSGTHLIEFCHDMFHSPNQYSNWHCHYAVFNY